MIKKKSSCVKLVNSKQNHKKKCTPHSDYDITHWNGELSWGAECSLGNKNYQQKIIMKKANFLMHSGKIYLIPHLYHFLCNKTPVTSKESSRQTKLHHLFKKKKKADLLSSTSTTHFQDGNCLCSSFTYVSSYRSPRCNKQGRYFIPKNMLSWFYAIFCPHYTFLHEAQFLLLYQLARLIGQIWLSAVQQFKGNHSLVDLLLSSEKCVLGKKCTICTSVAFQTTPPGLRQQGYLK